ncbi:CHAT domain-containing protein [Aquimarina sp. 2201CG14-23]|uniref:CHAT domain-containing protein n=1 Tax=Aquimarina mycalae TaxID=3040073 RepID=UPI002477DF90|nr:CHAT domain-containing protein [Aquimarina sp. 2201CG14-23]MDH7445722.1 CHAT domain-containing protein [Aquimarina sp. 2201CG14-23]
MLRYIRRLLICLLFFCYWQSVNAQDDAYEYYLSLFDNDTMSMPEIGKIVDSLIIKYHKNDEPSKIIQMAHHFSIQYYISNNYQQAIKYSKQEIAIYEELGITNNKYAGALYNLALFYSNEGFYEESFVNHKKVININEDEFSTAKSFCEIGQYYRYLGDFFKSKDYYTRGIFLLEKLDRKQLLVRKYIAFSQVLSEIDTENSLDLQFEILNKTNRLFSEATSYSFYGLRNYFLMNNGYANYYNTDSRFNFDKAKEYYFKNLKEAIEVEDSTIVNASYTNLGNLYKDSKFETQKDSALYFLNNSLRYCVDNDEKADVFHNISNYYVIKKEYLKALNNIHKTLMLSADLNQNIEVLPELNDLTISDNQYNILLALIQKATVLIKLHQKEYNIKYLELALANLLSADKLVDILIDVSEEDGSKLYWRKEASEIYLKGILVSETLKDQENAFYFSEKKKALLLIEDILENTDKLPLPVKILERDSKLKKKILDLENDIANQKHIDSSRLLENKRFDLKQEYQRLEDSLQILFPDYFKNKEIIRIEDLKDVQESLDKNSVIISYVTNKDLNDDSFNMLYAVIISNTQTEVIKVGNIDAIEKLIVRYREQLSKPFETEEDKLNYNETASRLYTLLIPKDKISIRLDQKHLVIIPDGSLQYIPFESLIIDKKTNRYLIENNEISYAYSMSFLQHNAKVERKPSQDVVSFAPITFTHSDLEDIANSNKEIEGVTRSVVGNNFSKSNASKFNFLNKTDDYNIIHLATHANFTDNLQIAFHDTNLEYHELYTSKNQAELVVLSACNTSLGEIAKGEGVMSLARGFFYAGANTVISSLWNANDKSTTQIMESFYRNLAKGQSKSKALHNAKINYLKSSSLSDASPHYWATFVLIGDAETKLFPSNYTFYWIILPLLLILIISVLILSFKKR